MTDPASKCPMQEQKKGAVGHGEAEHDGAHQSSAHCMSSMCCFHDTFTSPQLAKIGALLPGTQLIDRGKVAPSNADSTQKRPPRQI
ncbi:MAG: hypothetical protein ACEPO2_12860 [Pelagibaca sp.]